MSESLAQFMRHLIESGPRGTQSELARHVGVERQTVGKWRSGSTRPDRSHWTAIEEFFKLDPNTIALAAGHVVVDGQQDDSDLSPNDRRLAEKLATLSPEDRRTVKQLIDRLSRS